MTLLTLSCFHPMWWGVVGIVGVDILQTSTFSCNFKGFLSILFPQKACPKVFLFFLFCFFCFCLPFQNSILSICFLAISPFLENINIFGFFLFLFLAFSFLNVCLFLSNKLSLHPLFDIQFAFVFGCFFFLLFLFLFWLCMFQPFCFFVVMLALFLVCFLVLFCVLFLSSFLFWFQSMKKLFSPAILVFFEFCWLKG